MFYNGSVAIRCYRLLPRYNSETSSLITTQTKVSRKYHTLGDGVLCNELVSIYTPKEAGVMSVLVLGARARWSPICLLHTTKLALSSSLPLSASSRSSDGVGFRMRKQVYMVLAIFPMHVRRLSND